MVVDVPGTSAVVVAIGAAVVLAGAVLEVPEMPDVVDVVDGAAIEPESMRLCMNGVGSASARSFATRARISATVSLTMTVSPFRFWNVFARDGSVLAAAVVPLVSSLMTALRECQ